MTGRYMYYLVVFILARAGCASSAQRQMCMLQKKFAVDSRIANFTVNASARRIGEKPAEVIKEYSPADFSCERFEEMLVWAFCVFGCEAMGIFLLSRCWGKTVEKLLSDVTELREDRGEETHRLNDFGHFWTFEAAVFKYFNMEKDAKQTWFDIRERNPLMCLIGGITRACDEQPTLQERINLYNLWFAFNILADRGFALYMKMVAGDDHAFENQTVAGVIVSYYLFMYFLFKPIYLVLRMAYDREFENTWLGWALDIVLAVLVFISLSLASVVSVGNACYELDAAKTTTSVGIGSRRWHYEMDPTKWRSQPFPLMACWKELHMWWLLEFNVFQVVDLFVTFLIGFRLGCWLVPKMTCCPRVFSACWKLYFGSEIKIALQKEELDD